MSCPKKSVLIDPGCIACGTCAFIAPDVFEITSTATVKSGADLSKHWPEVLEAARSCPVGVIKVEENDSDGKGTCKKDKACSCNDQP